MSEDKKDEEIKVSEEKDGSVVVEVPGDLAIEDDQQETQMAEGGQADEDDGGDEDHPDDTDRIREARRARRKAKKEYIKKTNQEKDHQLAFLKRENEMIKARLAAMEQKSHTSDLARLDKAYQDEEARLNYAKLKMKEATDASDGQALVRAQELFFETRERMEKIRAFKERAEKDAQPAEAGPDPVIQSLANEWMDKNPWYDPNGSDRESRVAKRIDDQLAREGFDPATDDYWEELSSRLQDQLPHLYTQNTNETPRKRGPRSVVTGSEREVGGGASRNTFTLSPEQVRAMKDAGFWDDPKKRDKMIRSYAKYAQQNRG